MKHREPWLLCRMDKQVCLLAKDEKAFYIIEVGKRLDWETEEWLLRQGDIRGTAEGAAAAF